MRGLSFQVWSKVRERVLGKQKAVGSQGRRGFQEGGEGLESRCDLHREVQAALEWAEGGRR